MLIAVVVLSLAVIFLSAALIFEKREIRNIEDALRKVLNGGGRSIHSKGGSKDADRLTRQINELLSELRRQREEYEHKKHRMDQMITNISHDLRTPLTSAVGYVDMVRTGDLEEEEKQRELEIISERLERLRQLIDSFFEFSKVMSSEYTPDMTTVNVTALLEESVAAAYDNFEERGRHIELDIKDERREVSSNEIMLTRIFDNLISNALKHGTGDLKITREGDILSFINDISEGENIDTDRIFDEFYTTDISRTKGSTGLGLAIVKDFSEMLDIDIGALVEDEVFRITLDLSRIRL
jgi:signal transduction histidine kinase